MAMRLRLARHGAKNRPYYYIVAANSTSPRDGKFLEKVGTYNPMVAKDHPQRVTLSEDRIKYWLGNGALPTDRVAKILGAHKIIEMPTVRETPNKSQPKEKAVERAKEREEKIAAAKEAAKAAEEEAKAAARAAKEAEKEAKAAPKEPVKAEETTQLKEEAPAKTEETKSE